MSKSGKEYYGKIYDTYERNRVKAAALKKRVEELTGKQPKPEDEK